MIEKIKKRSLSDQVYKVLKNTILSEYQEGSLIPSENKLSKILNVSRVVVREALSRLRDERFIVTYQGKGSFVSNPVNFMGNDSTVTELDYNSFKEIMEFRSLIECSAVLQAVNNANGEDLTLLDGAVKNMISSSRDIDAFNNADYEFHIAVLKCAHNNTYLSAMESQKDNVIKCLDAMNRVNGSRDWALDLHPKIAQCIKDKNAKGAVDLLKNSGEYNIARMKELIFKE